MFQEVRSDGDNHDRNQIAELQSILGQYQHKLYAVADDVILPDRLYKTGWEAEGMIVILCLHLFMDSIIYHKLLQPTFQHVNLDELATPLFSQAPWDHKVCLVHRCMGSLWLSLIH